MINKFMVYDRDDMKLGVYDLDCDELINHANDIQQNLHDDYAYQYLQTQGTSSTATPRTTKKDIIKRMPEEPLPTLKPTPHHASDSILNYHTMFIMYGINIINSYNIYSNYI